MFSLRRLTYHILALTFVLAIPACGGSDPQSPASTTSISGTVVFDQSSVPAAGVDVTLEMTDKSMTMGDHMGDHWEQAGHMTTDSHGQFHFEYMHQPMHSYRVGVRDMSEWHTCDGSGRVEDGLVLRIPSQNP